MTETSALAYKSVTPVLNRLTERVLTEINDRSQGATCDEIEELTQMPHQTVSARITELRKAGFIVDSQWRRRTRSNRWATVWTKVRYAGPA